MPTLSLLEGRQDWTPTPPSRLQGLQLGKLRPGVASTSCLCPVHLHWTQPLMNVPQAGCGRQAAGSALLAVPHPGLQRKPPRGVVLN